PWSGRAVGHNGLGARGGFRGAPLGPRRCRARAPASSRMGDRTGRAARDVDRGDARMGGNRTLATGPDAPPGLRGWGTGGFGWQQAAAQPTELPVGREAADQLPAAWYRLGPEPNGGADRYDPGRQRGPGEAHRGDGLHPA